jgi:hypothetical protein
MAKREGKHEDKRHEEHARHRGRRARGGHAPEPDNTDEEEEKELHASEETERARGGHVPPHHTPHHHGRKHGGKVDGKHPAARPDRKGHRARGGSTADLNPTTAAGHMSRSSFQTPPMTMKGGDVGGHGPDRD